MAGRRAAGPEDPATRAFDEGLAKILRHPLFRPIAGNTSIIRERGNLCPEDGWALVTTNGRIHVHPTRRADPDEWAYVLAHCLVHLGFGHLDAEDKSWKEWDAACDYVVGRFLADIKFGRPPAECQTLSDLGNRIEEELYAEFRRSGLPSPLPADGVGGAHMCDMVPEQRHQWLRQPAWTTYFAQGLNAAVTSAINVAGGRESALGEGARVTLAQRARSWFISSYPLLGALAASFTLVEDAPICDRLQIRVAAVDDETKELFLNPTAGLDEAECRFVMAHELLHVALRHLPRRKGRDPFLWNVAADYVINRWLVEMNVGELPHLGVLYDPALGDVSVEALYDQITQDLRRARKLATLRGIGLGDMLERGLPRWWEGADGLTLDEFYRRCLAEGLEYHLMAGRGFLPAGLIEEIRALSQPPIPWDVDLARWFEHWFAPIEKTRSYARPSRRQAATPNIPRPRWVTRPERDDLRTFGIILDTSGSMDRALLAKALGAIASYAMLHEVLAVRLVFCDAFPYDQGYVAPEAIAHTVQVKGRGGTILQPGVDLIENAADFPTDGPILIITDGYCDRLTIRRTHAFLMPEGRSLPFVAKGPIFRTS